MSIRDGLAADNEGKRALLRRLAQGGEPVLIYGAGVYAYVLCRYLAACGVAVEATMVDAAYRTDGGFVGLTVLTLEEMADRLAQRQVVVGIANHPAAVRRLRAMGAINVHVIDVPDFLNIPAPFMDRAFVEANIAAFDDTRHLLADDLSRQTLAAAINAKISEDPEYLLPVVRPDHLYFAVSEFPLTADETLLDVGGFTGDSLRDFHAITQGRYDHVISLEPFADSYARLTATADALGADRITTVKLGAWDHPATLRLATRAMDIDNRIAADGDVGIEVDTIDAILDRLGRRPTFIKLDINGAEYRALAGARDTIRRHRPRIATKIHTKEDFLRLPRLLRDISPDIKLYLRQRNFMSMTLVLYGLF